MSFPLYRSEFRPSEQLDRPHVIAAVNAIVADDEADAQQQFQVTKRRRVALLLPSGRSYSDDEADRILDSPQGRQLQQMAQYSGVGTPTQVTEYLDRFAEHADADELIVAHQSPTVEERIRSVELLADAAELGTAAGRR